jgi:hypothetical protein
MPSYAYNFARIDALLERVLAEVGPDRFAGMRLLELEKLVRSYNAEGRLPGKTVLRATIHKFRASRWPATAPKRSGTRF